MIPLSQLYTSDDRRGANTVWQHVMGMLQVCQTNDPATLNAVKGALQLSSLSFQNVVTADHPNYLLGRDARGYQVGMLTNWSLYKTAWYNAMSLGVANDASIAGRALKYCIDAATVVAADLIPRITNNTEVLFFGHGLAAGIMMVLREKLRVAGKRVSNLWCTSQPRCITEETANAITAPSARYLRLDDAFCFAPPGSVMTSWEPPGTLEELYPLGETYVAPVIIRNQGRFLLNPGALSGDPLAWIDYVGDDALPFSGMRYYVLRHWARLSRREQAVSIEWFNVLNSVFGYTLERRLS